MSQLSPEEELSLYTVTRFPDAQKLRLDRKPLPGQAETFPLRRGQEQPLVPCAAKEVWPDGAKTCPAQSLLSDSSGASPVPPCISQYLPIPPCICQYLSIPPYTSPYLSTGASLSSAPGAEPGIQPQPPTLCTSLPQPLMQ